MKWVLLGCVIPDVPWILRRAIQTLLPAVDPYQLRLYALVQASLFASLLLAAGLSLLSTRPRRVFALLSVNAALALLLDALQTKWGNGVHLLAPFEWSTWSFDLFWPESPVTHALTAFGLGVVVWLVWREPGEEVPLVDWRPARYAASGAILGAYFLLPLPLADDAARADPHYIQTLRAESERPGRYVEFDRNEYVPRPGTDVYRTFAGDELFVRSDHPELEGTVSLRARFLSRDTLTVIEAHEHSAGFRTGASVLGLIFLALAWARRLFTRWSGRT